MKDVESKLSEIVSFLEEVARTDTIYRDVYLRRARELLGSAFPEREYRRLQSDREASDDLLRQIRSAVTHRAWSRVQGLIEQVRARKDLLDGRRTMLQLGTNLYDPCQVPLAPFSPALPGVTKRSPGELAELKAHVVTALSSLERHDPGNRNFYAGRRSCFEALVLPSADRDEMSTALDANALETDAVRALDHGDLNRLERLARQILTTRAELPRTVGCPPRGTEGDLAQPFSRDVEQRARKIGLRSVAVDLDAECGEYLRCCCVWQPAFPAQPLGLERRVSHDCTCGHPCPPGITASLKDTLDLLIVHPFINSAGERYLPCFTVETVLVEDFPEDDPRPGGTELLRLLGLTRRIAVSRAEVENALLRRGPDIVENILGLEPLDFRMVCIPFDVYSRLATTFGWGLQPRWTHFDGYQIWKADRLRALVGGDVRYGGRHHICSIGVDDDRENVVARLAVVHRRRFVLAASGALDPGDHA
jgi:hypothetical protein